MTTKRTFIRKFKNGNICNITLNYDNNVKVNAVWAREVESEWPEIEKEYLGWRKSIFNTYMESLPEYQQAMVLSKTFLMFNKKI